MPILVSSKLTELETLPKAAFRKNSGEIRFYKGIFSLVSEWVAVDDVLIEQAISLGERYDVVNIDALHVAAAIRGQAKRFVTTEKPNKPLYRIRETEIVYLLDGGS